MHLQNCFSLCKIKVLCIAFLVLFIANVLATSSTSSSKKYDKYALYIAQPKTEEQAKFLEALERNKFLDISIWNKPVAAGKNMQVMVNHIHENIFKDKNIISNVALRALVHNIQSVFDEQVLREDAFNPYKSKWEYIHTLEDIYKYLNKSARNFTDIAKVEVIGKTAEDRDILAFSVKNPLKHDINKVFMEAGSHGDEWLGPTFIMYFIDLLLSESYGPLKAIKKNYNWYFIPVLNPDGYEYAQTKDRLWKKNRRKTSENSIGVNVNRNFGYKFGTHDSSNDPDSDVYHGPNEFSESESQALRDFVERKRDGLMFYFSFHGQGQSFIIPYSDSLKHGGGNFHEMQLFANQAIAKIKNATGLSYKVGNAHRVLGSKYSGDSASWVKYTYRPPYVYTILGRDDNNYGYTLPNSQILPYCTDMKVGLTELLTVTPRYLRLGYTSDTDSSYDTKKSSEAIVLSIVLVITFFI